MKNFQDAALVISKPYVVGFTEAEGSFYITKKEDKRLTHGFAITQKLDVIVLKAIGFILNIKVLTKKSYFSLDTTNKSQMVFLSKFYRNTIKGIKSLEYRIWSRSFNKTTQGNKNYDYLCKVQEQIRHIRSIRHDKNFKFSHFQKLRKFQLLNKGIVRSQM